METSIQVGERFDYPVRADHIRQSSDKKTFAFTISTFSADRHGTKIRQEGIDFSDFLRNGVVLFNHDPNLVVGRAVNIFLRGGKLVAEMQFDEEDDFARNIRRKVEQKFLNATSIGFMVREVDFDADDDTMIITESELLEFSIVSVPSNREALVISRSVYNSEINSLRSDIADLRELVISNREHTTRGGNDQSVPDKYAEEAQDQADAAAEDSPVEAEELSVPEPQPASEQEEGNDLIHDEAGDELADAPKERSPKEVQPGVVSPNAVTFDEAWAIARSVVRRMRGQE